jgi:hypothetical protein
MCRRDSASATFSVFVADACRVAPVVASTSASCAVALSSDSDKSAVSAITIFLLSTFNSVFYFPIFFATAKLCSFVEGDNTQK